VAPGAHRRPRASVSPETACDASCWIPALPLESPFALNTSIEGVSANWTPK
jgi:hypothetical protein